MLRCSCVSLFSFLPLLIINRRPNAENPPPFPTHYPGDLEGDEEKITEVYHADVHRPSDPTVVYLEDDSPKREIRTGAKLAKVRTKK